MINKSIKSRELSQHDINLISQQMRNSLAADNKEKLDAEFLGLKQIAVKTDPKSLTDWDRESLRLATEYVHDESKDEFRRAINRIMKLAGLNPELENHLWTRNQTERRKINKN